MDATLASGHGPATPDPIRTAPRLDALRRSGLLDDPSREAFDRLTRLAATVLGAPIALVSLVDADRQVFAGQVGLPEPVAAAGETPLSHSFCQHTVTSRAPLIIADARDHPLVRDNPAVAELDVIAYAGIPLVTSDGYVLGSFCVIDHQPRQWTPAEVAVLTDLAGSALTEIELRATARLATARAAELEATVARLRQLEQAMSERAGQLEATVEAMADGVIIYGVEGRKLRENRAARALFGLDAQADYDALPIAERGARLDVRDGPGRPLSAADLPAMRVLRGEALQGADAMDLRFISLDGRAVEVNATGAPVRDAAGRIVGGVVVYRDVTERRRLEGERDAFLSSVSHDLKTPLTSIRGFAQLARRRLGRLGEANTVDTAAIADNIRGIETAAGRILMLVNDLVELTRSQAGGALPLEPQPVDLVALARRIVAAFPVPSTHRVVVEGLPTLTATVDPDRIERVIGNLLSNALKYSPRGGTVTVRIAREEARAIVSVRDQGLGIAAADLPRIFERFHRGANAVGRIEGTGVGLASARQIVIAHGGTLDVESQEGIGSTFTVRLPLDIVTLSSRPR